MNEYAYIRLVTQSYMIKKNFNVGIYHIGKESLMHQYYAFAVPPGAPYKQVFEKKYELHFFDYQNRYFLVL